MKIGVHFFRSHPKLGLESTQLQKTLKPKTFSLLTVLLVWIVAKCLLAQSSLLSSGSLVSDPEPDVTIEYIVDARDPGKKLLPVRAQIQGLPRGEITLTLSNPKEGSLEIGNRIGSLNVHRVTGLKSIAPKKNKFQF